ncbi:MAG TPA: SRPBCC family protein, partial [Chitinophagaceae bacterium]|nr:SRPBCC family protein [Chitinophagaceae bacterium]
PDPPPQLEMNHKSKMFSVSREYETDINTLFFTALDFTTRPRWQAGIKATDEVSHKLPQVGTHHRCVLDKGEINMITSSYSYSAEKIVYSETERKKQHAGYFLFEKLGENKTRVTFDFHLKNNFAMVTMFRLFMKKKYQNLMQQSLENLAEMVREKPVSVET